MTKEACRTAGRCRWLRGIGLGNACLHESLAVFLILMASITATLDLLLPLGTCYSAEWEMIKDNGTQVQSMKLCEYEVGIFLTRCLGRTADRARRPVHRQEISNLCRGGRFACVGFLFCPNTGWIDIDPTNNLMPSNRHITVAWGRDYGDVSPIRGVILGSGEHSLKVAVDVIPLHEPRFPLSIG